MLLFLALFNFQDTDFRFTHFRETAYLLYHSFFFLSSTFAIFLEKNFCDFSSPLEATTAIQRCSRSLTFFTVFRSFGRRLVYYITFSCWCQEVVGYKSKCFFIEFLYIFNYNLVFTPISAILKGNFPLHHQSH